MSTRQQYISELDAPPEWLQGYEDPVVRVRGNNSNKMHRPDPNASTPKPACNTQGNSGNYDVIERVVLLGTYEPCRICYGGAADE